jgi:predicted  nucleic acid-binding Zn-ribbon protein
MFNFFNNWFSKFFEEYDLEQPNETLLDRIVDLEERILKLETENVELTNCLYEIENRLQAKIDNIHPITYNLNSFKCGED